MAYKGIWPVAPTPFNDNGSVDYDGMRRHPFLPMHPDTRAQLIDLIHPLDPLVLNWGK